MGEIGEYWRDVKAAKKQGALDRPPQPRRCKDWICTSGCQYARNRSSFKTYRRVQMPPGTNSPIIGIGTVELEVMKRLDSNETGKVILYNVVHIPTAVCNSFNPITRSAEGLGHIMAYRNGCPAGLDDDENQLWYTKNFHGLGKLVLAGNAEGESYMHDDTVYMLSVHLSPEELEALQPPTIVLNVTSVFVDGL